MSFCISFNDHDNLQAIIYLVGTEIFGFHQTLQLWRLFKESTYQCQAQGPLLTPG